MCHDFVDPHSFVQFCKHDYCGCITTHGDDSCYCSAMAAYEVTCAKHGIHIVWRPLVPECQQTCGLGLTFTPCAAQDERACQALTYAPILEVSRPFVDICVGGCVCANDQYLDVNGVCKPIEQCQCFWKGQYLNAGDIKFDNIQEIPVNTVSYHIEYHTENHIKYHTE